MVLGDNLIDLKAKEHFIEDVLDKIIDIVERIGVVKGNSNISGLLEVMYVQTKLDELTNE